MYDSEWVSCLLLGTQMWKVIKARLHCLQPVTECICFYCRYTYYFKLVPITDTGVFMGNHLEKFTPSSSTYKIKMGFFGTGKIA